MSYDDDDDFDRPQKAPELPRELREKLFDYSDKLMPAIRYSAIGPEKWPAAVAYGAKGGFTAWRNPRATDTRMILNLGPDPQLHVGFEMSLIPAQHRIPRSMATERIKQGQCLRPEFNRLVVCIPAGQTLALPAVFDNAVRTVRDGTVVAGAAPFLIKVVNGQDEVDPPHIHPSLLPPSDGDGPAPMRPAAARRRA